MVGRYLASRGYLAFGHDHIGHGNSSGERVQGLVSFEEDYCVPVAAHCRARAKAEREKGQGQEEIPLFILGHSMGGLVALVTADNAPKSFFRGVVVMGPMIEVDPDIATPVNIFLAKCFSSWWPSKQLSSELITVVVKLITARPLMYSCSCLHYFSHLFVCLNAEVEISEITSDEDWVEKIKADELYWHGGIKVKQAMLSLRVRCFRALQYVGMPAVLNLCVKTQEYLSLSDLPLFLILQALQQFEEEDVSGFNLPLFIQQGSDDKICRPEGAKRLYERVSSRDKTIKMYPGARHNLFIEKGAVPDAALGDAYTWMKERMRPGDSKEAVVAEGGGRKDQGETGEKK